MASTNLDYGGRTGAIKATASVSEVTTSGTTRTVHLVVKVQSNDGFSGRRDASYSVQCTQSGTDDYVGMYEGFYVEGGANTIFDETFDVSIARGSSSAYIDLSFTVTMRSGASGDVSINGTITKLTLTAEPAYSASTFTVNKDTVKHGENLIFSINRGGASLTHALYYWNAVSSRWVSIDSGVGSSYNWSVPDLSGNMPNATSAQLRLLCETYNGSSNIGSYEVRITMVVKDPTVPAIAGSEITLGSKCTVSCPRGSSNFTVELIFVFGKQSVTITKAKVNSVEWTPSYDLAKEIPDLTYGTGTLKCVTYNGTAKVGEKTATIKAVVPNNEETRPKFDTTGFKVSIVSDLTGDLAGLYIRGRTGLKAEFTASAPYSTIRKCSVTAGSVSADGNPAIIDVLVNEGEVTVTGTVTDARGFSTSIKTSIHVLAYKKPKVTPYTGYSSVLCERALATGELNTSGTYLAIKAGRSFSSFVYGGTERNACILRYRHKVSNAAEFGGWITLLEKGDPRTEVSILVSDVVPSTSRSYDVEISALDDLGGEHRLAFQIMTSAISFVLYDGVDGAGFGKYPEDPHTVDIASHMTLIVRGKLVILGSDWVPLTFADGVFESPYEYGRAIDCQYQVKEGNHVYVAFNCSFVHQGTQITVNKTPIPEGTRPARPICSVCPTDNGGTAMVQIDPDGYIRVVWVHRDGEAGEHVVLWIDGYLDYWT